MVTDWSVQNLAFGSFKTRGELLLKGAETAEVVSLMEDSLMVLGSLMSNRCSLWTPESTVLMYVVYRVGTMLHSRKTLHHGFKNYPTHLISLRTGWWYKTCGCTLRLCLLEEILLNSYPRYTQRQFKPYVSNM